MTRLSSLPSGGSADHAQALLQTFTLDGCAVDPPDDEAPPTSRPPLQDPGCCRRAPPTTNADAGAELPAPQSHGDTILSLSAARPSA